MGPLPKFQETQLVDNATRKHINRNNPLFASFIIDRALFEAVTTHPTNSLLLNSSSASGSGDLVMTMDIDLGLSSPGFNLTS